MKARILTLFLLLGSVFTANSQDLLEMVKHDLNAERRSIIAEAIIIPATKEAEFWSLYNDMEQKLGVLTEKRSANIKKFAENFDNMTDDVADELANNYFDLNAERFKIYRTYYKKMSKVISKTEAARFIQLLGQIQLIIDVQVAAEVPLIE